MDNLENCHRRLATLLGPGAEPIEVLRCAEEHRAYWRPERVRVILLAESHVYTSVPELARRVRFPAGLGGDIPDKFVRLVYCLGYGEDWLLDRPIVSPRNSGTPQFWKTFYSCCKQVRTNEDFAPLQSQVPLTRRIQNKLAILHQLKEMGVWLVDTSLAALYLPGRPKPGPSILEAALRASWDTYVSGVVREANPLRIICIGRGVSRALGDRLLRLRIPVTVIAQPNARLSTAEHFAGFQTYYQVVQQALQE